MGLFGRKGKGKKGGEGAAPLFHDKAVVIQLEGRKGRGHDGPAKGRTRGAGRGNRDKKGGAPDRDEITEALRYLAANPQALEGGMEEEEGTILLVADPPGSLARIEAYDEADVQKRTWSPYTEGTRWKCQRCGRCCRENWRVNLTWAEYDRLKDVLDIRNVVEDEMSGMSHPVMIIEGGCRALDTKRGTCTIYRRRMYSCATFPFSLAPDGTLMISRYCEGFGHGPVIDEAAMVKHILKWRRRAGMDKEHLKR